MDRIQKALSRLKLIKNVAKLCHTTTNFLDVFIICLQLLSDDFVGYIIEHIRLHIKLLRENKCGANIIENSKFVAVRNREL